MQFRPNQLFEHDGVVYRVSKGNRCPGDMVIEFTAPPGHRPSIAHSLILLQFKAQVEENNYGTNGRVMSGRGKFYLLDAIKDVIAFDMDWQEVASRIKNQSTKAAQERHDNPFV